MGKGIATKCAPPVEGQEGKENETCGEVGGRRDLEVARIAQEKGRTGTSDP
jgi:hypothetical protein